MKTETNNALIAEFMGANLVAANLYDYGNTNNTPTDTSSTQWNSPQMRYNKDWSWLMPVVDKIESLGYAVEIVEAYCMIKKGEDVFTDIGGGDYTKLSATYEAVTRFITLNNWGK